VSLSSFRVVLCVLTPRPSPQVLNKQTAAHVEGGGGGGDTDEGEAAAEGAAAEKGDEEKKGGEKGEEKSDAQKAKDWFKGDEQGH
jgi:hypothetical protein